MPDLEELVLGGGRTGMKDIIAVQGPVTHVRGIDKCCGNTDVLLWALKKRSPDLPLPIAGALIEALAVPVTSGLTPRERKMQAP